MNIKFRLPDWFVPALVALILALLAGLAQVAKAFAAPAAPQYLNSANMWLADNVNSSQNWWLTTGVNHDFVIGASFHTNTATGIRVVIPFGKIYTPTLPLYTWTSGVSNTETHYEGNSVVVTGQSNGWANVAVSFTAQLTGMMPITIEVLESSGGGFTSAPLTLSVVEDPALVTFSSWYSWDQSFNHADLLIAKEFPVTARVESSINDVFTYTEIIPSRVFLGYDAHYASFWGPDGSDSQPQSASAWKFDTQCTTGAFGLAKTLTQTWVTVFNGPDYTSNIEVIDNQNNKTTLLFYPGELRTLAVPQEGVVYLKVGINLCGGVRWNPDSNFDLGINAPTSAPYGGWPVSPRFTVTNTLDYDREVTVSTWVGGLAWGGSVGYYQFPQDGGFGWTISNMVADSNGMTIDWRGWIQAHHSVTLGFTTDTLSWGNPTPVPFVKLTVNEKTVVQTLLLTEGPGLGGAISAWVYDEPTHQYWLGITTTSQFMGQFVMTSLTSNCQLQGLPTGFVGNYARTFEYHQYTFGYLSGGPTCNLVGTFKHLEAGLSVAPIFTVTGSFAAPGWTEVAFSGNPADGYHAQGSHPFILEVQTTGNTTQTLLVNDTTIFPDVFCLVDCTNQALRFRALPAYPLTETVIMTGSVTGWHLASVDNQQWWIRDPLLVIANYLPSDHQLIIDYMADTGILTSTFSAGMSLTHANGSHEVFIPQWSTLGEHLWWFTITMTVPADVQSVDIVSPLTFAWSFPTNQFFRASGNNLVYAGKSISLPIVVR